MTQFAAALAALGLYRGANTPAEHAAEARRLGGEDAYRVRLANALLGAAQTEAILADTLPLGPEARLAAYEQQFATAGAADSPARQIHFTRWQMLGVSDPLGQMAQDVAPGPIPLAAHAAEGLQQLLNLIAASQNVTPDHADRLAGPVTGELRAARQSLVDAIGNVNILLNLLDAISWQRSAPMNSRRPPRSRRRAAPGHCRHEHQPAPNPVLHQAIMDSVDNQLRDNTPPETRRTFERLVAAGHTLEDARRLIGCVVSTVICDVLTQHRSFDEAAYVAALQRLPILPWEEGPASS